jgi:hypothetical protein
VLELGHCRPKMFRDFIIIPRHRMDLVVHDIDNKMTMST